MGWQPGWLWWSVAAAVVVAGAWLLVGELNERRITEAYIADRIAHHAQAQSLDLALVQAVVEAESGGDWRARSDADARGLMQVTPIALEDVRERFDIGRGDLYEVDYNLRVGTLYLRYLLDRFDGDVTLAVAAYHMGPTAIAKAQRASPRLASRELVRRHAGPQTRAYVNQVLDKIDAE